MRHLTTLRAGGYLYLEFPTRYHHRELHTGLLSFEWLPRSLRNVVLSLVSASGMPLPNATKTLYRSILETGLQQISLREVRRWLADHDAMTTVLHHYQPSPGIVRTVVSVGYHATQWLVVV